MSRIFDFILHIAAIVIFAAAFTVIGVAMQQPPAERDLSTLAVFRGE